MKKRYFAAIVSLFMFFCCVFCGAGFGEERVETLTYAVYPYLPDTGYYQELIERRWAELEPDIRLVRAECNCYHDGRPEGIDVVMYDAVMRDQLIADGWIRPISPEAVWESGDIFPSAIEGFTVGGERYGIPVFICGNFLIYDRNDEALSAAEHLTDLEGEAEILVVYSRDKSNRLQYALEVVADARGEGYPSMDGVSIDDCMALINRLAIDAHEHDEDERVALAYDSGTGRGYIGFSESMHLLENRMDTTWIKAVSFSNGKNIPRVYMDAAAVTAGTEGQRYQKCLELMNVMAEADVLTALSVQNGRP